jgi:hypothetical protein
MSRLADWSRILILDFVASLDWALAQREEKTDARIFGWFAIGALAIPLA